MYLGVVHAVRASEEGASEEGASEEGAINRHMFIPTFLVILFGSAAAVRTFL